tara:strand:- start:3306 stop:3905 length:600 start_codon:yes stop_codon:yes gene_type:complete
MRITSAEFIKSATDLDSCPDFEFGEMAFIGRSNVGKSSLINLLAERNGLAKVSSTPGATKLINFFLINNAWSLVDLPGYGYAKRSASDQRAFNEFVSEYLTNRDNLICVFILIDGKIPPQTLDLDFVEWVVQSQIPFALIFTKTDKVKEAPLKKNIAKFKEALAERCDGTPAILTCSTKNKKGRVEVLNFIEKAVSMGG